MLWIGLHLPALSLESFAATLAGGADPQRVPLALVQARRITAADARARALGVAPGLQQATALALAPRLLLGQADGARDAAALAVVAHAALAFTPAVSLHPPQGVLLEVGTTLRYFGGRDALLQRLRESLAPLRHHVRIAVAPTAQGAAWLAQWRDGLCCEDGPALQQALDALPLGLCEAVRQQHEALQAMGLQTLGDLRRLPRAGVARRFGEDLLEALDRAFGRRPDPRQPLVPPETFDSRLELFTRADTAGQVLHGAGLLLSRLVAWLAARHALVRRFSLQMLHEPGRSEGGAHCRRTTELVIALAEPSRDVAHLQGLLRERLARLRLAAPTLELRLQAHDTVQCPLPHGELFPGPSCRREGLVRLVERLQARLGAGQVQRPVAVADHRPERAVQWQPVDAARPGRPARGPVAGTALPARPVWLLADPQPLPEHRACPWLDGRPLQLLCGPERIESGWWDGDLAGRDYFIARSADDALVWIYRERLPAAPAAHGWFLHGRFG